MIYQNVFKRALDLIVSLLAVILFLPLICFIVLVSHFHFKGKVFFVQERIGYNLATFKIFKFKTMVDLKDVNGDQVNDEKRLTKWGTFLRVYSLDEIPQFLNIIKGDLSLVGPRPLLEAYLPYFTKEELARHQVKPGLTGLVQVSGKNAKSWKERFIIDQDYIKNQSFILDAVIILKTLILMVRGQKSHYSQSLIKEREQPIFQSKPAKA